jgi:hypothetical protein
VSVLALVTRIPAFGRCERPSSMVLPDYLDEMVVTPSPEGTSVLRSRNVRSIGRKDRCWQDCAVKLTLPSVDVCAFQTRGSY